MSESRNILEFAKRLQSDDIKSPEDDPDFVALMEEFAAEQDKAGKGTALKAEEENVTQFIKQLPRKTRRKMFKKDSFSTRFKNVINKK